METLRGHSDEVKKTSNKNGGNTKWKWTLWRCVSYWNWWYCIAMLVYQRVYHIWVVVLKIFCFKLYLGKIPILTNVVQMGWFKHQLQSTRVIKLPTSAGIKQCNCMLTHWIHEWLIIMVNVGKYTYQSHGSYGWSFGSLYVDVILICQCGFFESLTRFFSVVPWLCFSHVGSNQDTTWHTIHVS